MISRNIFFKLINNTIFRKAIEHRDIKLLTKEKRRDYVDLEPNYHFTKLSIKILLATEMKKTRILMNKPVYL